MKDSFGSKYRIYLNRFRRGELKPGAIVELPMANGYEIRANRVVKKRDSYKKKGTAE